MKKLLLAVLLVAFISCIACHKEHQSGVSLRIQNTTSKSFTDVSSNGVSFGSVDALATTPYKPFQKILEVPFATVVVDADTLGIGNIFIDLPSYFTRGKYTLQIVADTSTYNGYSCTFIGDPE